jgi:hypothetical protein
MLKLRPLLPASLVAVLCLCGCYHYRVTAKDTAKATESRSEVLWSAFWGLSQQDIDTRSSCEGNPVAEVRASTNLGFVLLTVVTLGILSPMQVEWVCAKDQQPANNDSF